ncbi:MAG: aquaporin family protein [Clostridiales bacterium]|jgi:glycerol uptake facilitator protein|nr:aquaporin family protein [Clostridiales bacterium]
MQGLIGELLGTFILCFLGDSVVANVILDKTKGNGSGWAVITLGWMVAVMVPVLMFGAMSGAHFNPAVTIGLAINSGDFSLVPGYIAMQMIGGILGGLLVWVFYKDHFDATKDRDTKLGVFATGPAIRNTTNNFISEFVATFMLIFAIIGSGQATDVPGPISVAAIILAMGTALGGTTGYALNPARDLGPRIAYVLAPIKDKRDPDWSYAWIPVVGPICGGIVAGIVASLVW